MQGVYCPGDVHWARLEASALGSLIAACPAWKRKEIELHISNPQTREEDQEFEVLIVIATTTTLVHHHHHF